MRNALLAGAALALVTAVAVSASGQAAGVGPGQVLDGKRLFEQATFGGNGRTCRTCHGEATGTVSPQDAQKRFKQNPDDPLFLLDGGDDGQGHGVTRMLSTATILMTIPMASNVPEKRGRRFFEDLPPDPTDGLKPGLCAHCHSGPLLNLTNEFARDFIGLPIPAGQRFISVGVSEFNPGNNPVREFIFNQGQPNETHVLSPDPGRALITGIIDDPQIANLNAFKISPLRGIRLTAPYFHDNSASTLEDVARHYALFFNVVTGGVIVLTPQDQADMVAYMKLLD